MHDSLERFNLRQKFLKLYSLFFFAFFLPITPIFGHGGAPAQPGEISFTLEEIFLFTMAIVLISPIILFKIIRLDDKNLLIILISLATTFLFLDYLVLKYIIYA